MRVLCVWAPHYQRALYWFLRLPQVHFSENYIINRTINAAARASTAAASPGDDSLSVSRLCSHLYNIQLVSIIFLLNINLILPSRLYRALFYYSTIVILVLHIFLYNFYTKFNYEWMLIDAGCVVGNFDCCADASLLESRVCSDKYDCREHLRLLVTCTLHLYSSRRNDWHILEITVICYNARARCRIPVCRALPPLHTWSRPTSNEFLRSISSQPPRHCSHSKLCEFMSSFCRAARRFVICAFCFHKRDTRSQDP